MHPEMLRELTAQRGREMRARAQQAGLVRLARLVRRRREHDLADQTGGFVITAIPDYVDGSFRTGPAAGEPAGTEAGQAAPATRRAA
jgi:hypothetical protein